MVSLLLLIALVAAVFVGFNIGGSSTGVAWGPPVGARITNKTAAAALMTFFVFLGGWTVDATSSPHSAAILSPQTLFSTEASIVILAFIGFGMLLANLYGVPRFNLDDSGRSDYRSRLATGQLDYAVVGSIMIWWIIAPVVGFWFGAIIGRHFYPYLDQKFALQQSSGPLSRSTGRGSFQHRS